MAQKRASVPKILEVAETNREKALLPSSRTGSLHFSREMAPISTGVVRRQASSLVLPIKCELSKLQDLFERYKTEEGKRVKEAPIYYAASAVGHRPYMEDYHCILDNLEDYSLWTRFHLSMDMLRTASISKMQQVISTKSMRDFSSIKLKTTGPDETRYIGVFDGHGGDNCSKTLMSSFAYYVTQSQDFKTDLPQAIANASITMDEAYCEHARNNMIMDGSTAVQAFIRNKDLIVANVGDSRAVLVKKTGKVLALSRDHKPDNPEEQKMIEAKGGFVHGFHGCSRVNGILAVARSYGDVILKSVITATPDIMMHRLQPEDAYLVMATDGLWDVMSNMHLGQFLAYVSISTIKLTRL